MKTALTVSSVLITLLILTSCLLEPGTGDNGGGQTSVGSSSSAFSDSSASSSSSSSSSSGITPAIIRVTIYDTPKGIIVVDPISITQVMVVVTNPSGSFQQQLWYPGLTNVLTFYSYENGLYRIAAFDYDEFGNIGTNGISYDLTTGNECDITLSLGGNVVVIP